MIDVAIVGAAGYAGGELLRLLIAHPEVKVRCAVSETFAGQPVHKSFPGLIGTTDLLFVPYADGESVKACDVVLLAQENTKAMGMVPSLVEAGAKVVDLSADFRFRNTDVYAAWYGKPHACPQINATAIYGLPEINREALKSATVVGNPGCHATAGILALAPLVANDWIDPASIVIDSKTGVSGAGRSKFSLDYHYPEMNESVSAYKIAGTHRHTPEIEMALGGLHPRSKDLALTFTPHLIPMTRGILATGYATLHDAKSTEELLDLYATFYSGHPFVAILPDALPATKYTQGTNYCQIGLSVDPRNRRVTVVSCLDNLVKGAAGQAIQNMNLICGLEETAGLRAGGLWP